MRKEFSDLLNIKVERKILIYFIIEKLKKTGFFSTGTLFCSE
jgi:hypothetical protein